MNGIFTTRTAGRLVALGVATSLAFAACGKRDGAGGPGTPGGETAKADTAKKTDEPGVPVSVIVAERGNIVATVTFSAAIESEQPVKVYPQATGLVEAVLAEEGLRVRAGQALIRLDDDDASITLRRAEIELRKLRADSVRTGELFRRDLVSRDEFETIVYQVSRARLALEEAELALRRTKIRAPVDGVISSRAVEIGDRVSPAAAIYTLVTMDRLIANVHVPGRHRPNLRIGQPARLSSDMIPGVEIDGVIERISPVVDPQSGTVKVTVRLSDPARRFTPGMFANVALITERQSGAILAPKEALVYEGGQAYTFTVDSGKARRVRLDIGLANAREVQVVGGLARGDSVIVVGQEGLRDGALVRVIADARHPLPPEAVRRDTTARKRS